MTTASFGGSSAGLASIVSGSACGDRSVAQIVRPSSCNASTQSEMLENSRMLSHTEQPLVIFLVPPDLCFFT
uniref:Uncharacterized protein n=1 Tax=Globisporangium ultimum (strain ATCC 200006 / CBS 805.95 / DAOM BR144) TaxID=431595 RepID=K3WMZ3_GLOUD